MKRYFESEDLPGTKYSSLWSLAVCNVNLWSRLSHRTAVPAGSSTFLLVLRASWSLFRIALTCSLTLLVYFTAPHHLVRCLCPLLVHIPHSNQERLWKATFQPSLGSAHCAATRLTLVWLPPKLGRGNHEVNYIFLPPCQVMTLD